jgi:hypothetical protein
MVKKCYAIQGHAVSKPIDMGDGTHHTHLLEIVTIYAIENRLAGLCRFGLAYEIEEID